MERYWLLTWTTYGTWLPGDDRGFVSNVRGFVGPEVRHNRPGTEPDAKLRGLWLAARDHLAGLPVYLTGEHAQHVLKQFQETAVYRGWELLAVAIMANYVHLIVGVPGDPEPDSLLRDFKSYASRSLNRLAGRPAGGTWWTESGSRRKLPDAAAVRAAVSYVQAQEYPLLIWCRESGEASGGRKPPDSGLSPTQNQGAYAPRSPDSPVLGETR